MAKKRAVGKEAFVDKKSKAPVKTDAKKPEGRIFSILGIVSAVLSLIVLPIIFGLIAVILGVIGVIKNDKKLGAVAIVLGVVFSVASIILTMIFLNSI